MRRIWEAISSISSDVALFSGCVFVVTLPAGLAMGLNGWWLGWLLIVLTVPAVTVVCLAVYWVGESDLRMLVTGVVGCLVGVVVGVVMVVSGIDGIVNFEPECEPSAEVDCRWIITSSGGTSTGGVATVSEQRRDATFDAVFWLIVPGSLLLVAMAGAGYGLLRFARNVRDTPDG